MFLSLRYSGYNRHDEQVAAGLFLVVAQKPATPIGQTPELRAVVRYVRFRQCGHFMMGTCRIGKCRSMVLSGSYGGDGLPVMLDYKQGVDAGAVWERMHPIPADMQAAFWNGEGGHNSAGSEGPAMKAWALANIRELRR